LFAVLAVVLLGVCSAQNQLYHPQGNVLTGLNYQAVGATSSSPLLLPYLICSGTCSVSSQRPATFEF
jgi:hypothetical protein